MIKTADRLLAVGEYYFSKKLDEVRAMQARGLDVVNLGIGSPDLAPSPETLKAASDALQKPNMHGYQSYRSTPELRRAISGWYKATYGVDANPETEILPLLGSKEGILYISLAFLNPGDQALIPDPGYPAYQSVTRMIGAVPLTYDITESQGWLPDLDALEKRDLSKVKIMWVNYPHMPTGRDAEPALFEKLVKFARKHQILVVNDNPYSLVLTQKPLSILSHDPAKDCAMELNSMSKAFNMAGWRVGMLIGKKEFTDAVLQVKSNVDSGMFYSVQSGAIAAFKNPESWHGERNETYLKRRKVAERLFAELGFSFDPNQVGLFLWAKAPDSLPDVEQLVDKLLVEKNIFITPGFIFGENGRRFARISLCATVERLEMALQRLKTREPGR